MITFWSNSSFATPARLSVAGQAALLWLAAATTGMAQLRDSFEAPQPTWSVREADCGVRVLAHERSYREARSGQASEHLRLMLGTGTYVRIAQPIGRAPVIRELLLSLFVKADRPNLQLMARVVFPRNFDRGTGQPITRFLYGDSYTDVGEWQQLALRDVAQLLERETRHARTLFGQEIDPREAYIDTIVVNAYAGEGPVSLWLDDLEIQGYVNIDGNQNAEIVRRTESGSAPEEVAAGAVVQGSLLLVRGRPLMPRAIQHQGEPLEWLQSLGFNTIKLSASPAAEELNAARRLGLWLIAPPPYADGGAGSEQYGPVIAWSLGSRLTGRDLASTEELAREVRSFDPHSDRPLLAGVDSEFGDFSRVATLLALARPTLGTSQELADLRRWLLTRPRLARAGTPSLAAIETQRTPRLGQQLVELGQGGAWEEDVDPDQIRLATYCALAAGARGVVFPSEKPLAIDTQAAALRTDSLRLINMELRLLEPWIAGGQLSEELASGDASVQVSVIQTDRSRLLLVTQHAPAQQYVLGPPPRSSLNVLVPGVGVSDRAYQVTLGGALPLKIAHTGGGARIVLENAPHAAAIVLTQDPLALHHLNRTLADFRQEAAHLRCDVGVRRLAKTWEIDQQLTQSGHALPQAAAWLREAQAHLDQARRLWEAKDFSRSHESAAKAESLLARVRRGHWEQHAAVFPSPAASPCLAQFTTLPLLWTSAERIRRGAWGPNVQRAGDMESLDQMLKSGWQQERRPPEGVECDVSLTLQDPRSGRSALRLRSWAVETARSPIALERPVVWVTSSPVPARQGQLARIHAWVHVPRPIAASGEGLLVFDSIGGSDLGDRVRVTQGYRELTLYRSVPHSGDLSVTFALTGLGEATIDDLSVSLLEPEPIRPE